ncbi:MAG: alkaline phosphatase family protein [Sphingobacteriales bacterium]|nr:MAG: alkaline phosphatase family protein [Sphingobacteriales bacterium]
MKFIARIAAKNPVFLSLSKFFSFIYSCLLFCVFLFIHQPVLVAQPNNKEPKKHFDTKPKLVVGIVVDQMRPDYVERFWERLGNKGLKRLISEGYNCKNTQFNYVPTYTAPGHASIYTGTTPSVHGVIGNQWYHTGLGKVVYCTGDTLAKALGGNLEAGKMSPRNLLSTTITDELKLLTNFKSKVIGISLKDRGAILPAGHTADAAYWYDGVTGNFMSSDFYFDVLPEWVTAFNNLKYPEKYQQQNWETLFPIHTYTQSRPDNQPYEETLWGETAPVFPHKTPDIVNARRGGFEVVKCTPYGNTLLKDFAIAAIEKEQLGKTIGITDFIAISFSSTDVIGHIYGPRSIEIEDTYLRFDKDIEDLLQFLDNYLGLDNTLIFMTADHAVADVAEFAKSVSIPAGNFNKTEPVRLLKSYLSEKYSDSLVVSVINEQIYFNHRIIAQKKLPLHQIQEETARFMLQFEGVAFALPAYMLSYHSYTDWPRFCIQNGFYPKRSGDVAFALQPGWMEGDYAGTTHGSSYTYDAHVPLYWFGWKIPKGKSSSSLVYITDIAPTLAILLKTAFPNSCTGKPISDLLEFCDVED